MKTTKITSLLALLLLVVNINGQSQTCLDYMKSEKIKRDAYIRKTKEDYKVYRDKVNAEFADYMKCRWKKMEAQKELEPPKQPEPPQPIICLSEAENTSPPISLSVENIDLSSRKKSTKQEREPIIEIEERDEIYEEKGNSAREEFEFDYYGIDCSILVDKSLMITLPTIKEESVAGAWVGLSDDVHTSMVRECIRWQHKLKLSEWGYISFVREFCDSYFGSIRRNESQVVQMFILTQSGYSVRIARVDDKLVLLMPFDATLYSRTYFTLDQKKFYILDKSLNDGMFYIFDHAFPNEQIVSLDVPHNPDLSYKYSENRVLTSRRYPEMTVNVSANKSLIDFYNDFPYSNRWNVYTNRQLSSEAHTNMYSQLNKHIAGKSELEAVEMILNFVQTAFEYKTDGEQFGYERPLFPEETLYYPYSDCEDRSILFAHLVNRLLYLDVILLDYPGHIATAVAFTTDVAGDQLRVEGKKYIVCDPTYIGAEVGLSMPEFRDMPVDVISIF